MKVAAGLLSVLLLSGAVLTTQPTAAQEQVGGYGVGLNTCGTYVENRRVPDKFYDLAVASWFYGFASGYNFYLGKPQAKGTINQNSVLVYLDKYCRENPLASVAVGADELVKVYSQR